MVHAAGDAVPEHGVGRGAVAESKVDCSRAAAWALSSLGAWCGEEGETRAGGGSEEVLGRLMGLKPVLSRPVWIPQVEVTQQHTGAGVAGAELHGSEERSASAVLVAVAAASAPRAAAAAVGRGSCGTCSSFGPRIFAIGTLALFSRPAETDQHETVNGHNGSVWGPF